MPNFGVTLEDILGASIACLLMVEIVCGKRHCSILRTPFVKFFTNYESYLDVTRGRVPAFQAGCRGFEPRLPLSSLSRRSRSASQAAL